MVLVVLVVVLVVLGVVLVAIEVVASHYCYKDLKNHPQDHKNHYQDHLDHPGARFKGCLLRVVSIFLIRFHFDELHGPPAPFIFRSFLIVSKKGS